MEIERRKFIAEINFRLNIILGMNYRLNTKERV